MTTPSDLCPAETIPSDLINKLRDIAAQRRRLEQEEEKLLAQLAGAATGTGETFTPFVDNIHERPEPAAPSPDATTPAIDRENLITVVQAAFEWKCSAKTMRKRADVYGAIRHVGGAVYVDRLAFIRGVNFQNLPNFSISKKSKKPHRQISKTGKNA